MRQKRTPASLFEVGAFGRNLKPPGEPRFPKMSYSDRPPGKQRYFIDIRDGNGTVADQEGAEFATLEAALDEAKASARDIVRQYMSDRIPLTATCVEIRDARVTRSPP